MAIEIYATARGVAVVCDTPHVCPRCQHYGYLWVSEGGFTRCWVCADRQRTIANAQRPDELV